MNHELHIEGGTGLFVWLVCSCNGGGTVIYDGHGHVTLDELNRLAHEHIEAADRAPLIR